MVPSLAIIPYFVSLTSWPAVAFPFDAASCRPHLLPGEGTGYVPIACDVDDKPRLLARPEETSMVVTVASLVKRSPFTAVMCTSSSRVFTGVRTPTMSRKILDIAQPACTR
jgi:hypothetical protein